MAERQVTYNSIKNLISQYCKSSQIKNYQTFNQTGYVNGTNSFNQTITVGSYNNNGTNTNINLNFLGKIVNNIEAVTEDTIDNDINNFINNNLGMNNLHLERPVNDNNYMNFLLDMAIFVTTKVCLIDSNNQGPTSASQNSTVPRSILVYVPSNNTFNNLIPIDIASIENRENELMITAEDLIAQIQTVMNSVANNIRVANNKINFTITLA